MRKKNKKRLINVKRRRERRVYRFLNLDRDTKETELKRGDVFLFSWFANEQTL